MNRPTKIIRRQVESGYEAGSARHTVCKRPVRHERRACMRFRTWTGKSLKGKRRDFEQRQKDIWRPMARWPSLDHLCSTTIFVGRGVGLRSGGDRVQTSKSTSRGIRGRQSGKHSMAARPSFTIESEDVVYKRYMTVYNRRVVFPSRDTPGGAGGIEGTGGAGGDESSAPPEVHEFDVVGHPGANFHFVVAFPFHPPADPSQHWSEGSVTLIKEYDSMQPPPSARCLTLYLPV